VASEIESDAAAWTSTPFSTKGWVAAATMVAAQAEGRFLVTQDLDFSDRRKFAPGTHHGVLIVRLPDSEQWRIGDYVTAWLSSPDIESWARCFVVATQTKVRVLRPAS